MGGIREVAGLLWEPFLSMPTAWRAASLLFIALIVAYALGVRLGRRAVKAVTHLAWRTAELVGSLLLLPEFLLTRRLRAIGQDPVPGAYAVGDGIQVLVRSLMSLDARAAELTRRARPRRKGRGKVLVVAALVVASTPVIAWETRPHMSPNGVLAGYVDAGIERWCSLEGWVFESQAHSTTRWRCESGLSRTP